MELPTPRLLLREIRPEDAESVWAYRSNGAYLERAGRSAPRFDSVVAELASWREWAAEVPRLRYQLAVVRDGGVIGTCRLWREAARAPEAEFGCEIDFAASGQGLGREASAALIDFGFYALALERIWATPPADGTRGVRMLEALGFHSDDGVRFERKRASFGSSVE